MRRVLVSFVLVGSLLASAGCYRIPGSVKAYAAELPARANGQYAALDPALQKQLVMKDALLQCSIDLEGDKTEATSDACKCSTSASDNWLDDCRGWLGPHTPQQQAAPPAPDAPAPAPGNS